MYTLNVDASSLKSAIPRLRHDIKCIKFTYTPREYSSKLWNLLKYTPGVQEIYINRQIDTKLQPIYATVPISHNFFQKMTIANRTRFVLNTGTVTHLGNFRGLKCVFAHFYTMQEFNDFMKAIDGKRAGLYRKYCGTLPKLAVEFDKTSPQMCQKLDFEAKLKIDSLALKHPPCIEDILKAYRNVRKLKIAGKHLEALRHLSLPHLEELSVCTDETVLKPEIISESLAHLKRLNILMNKVSWRQSMPFGVEELHSKLNMYLSPRTKLKTLTLTFGDNTLMFEFSRANRKRVVVYCFNSDYKYYCGDWLEAGGFEIVEVRIQDLLLSEDCKYEGLYDFSRQ